tara:strand:+ start:474 stop:1124 length:651 start_codon:yes stop_codon:yes gene_type:complete
LAKRLSDEQKKQIAESFTQGKTLDELAIEFNYTKATISRNLKKFLGDKTFKELIENNPSEIKQFRKKDTDISNDINKNLVSELNTKVTSERDYFAASFMEIAPLDYEFDNTPQKDLSSSPISDIDLPKVVFMVVNKNIELEVKYLKEYPDWHFLSQKELNRKTIEIHEDLKFAKRVCNKEQKVIKVPNSDVLKIVAPLLLSRGISRIVNADKLIAL